MPQNQTYMGDVPLYSSNPLFQMVSVLMIAESCSTSKSQLVSIERIMSYMWGLGSKRNLDKLIQLKKNHSVDVFPMVTDANVIMVVRQCVYDGYLVVRKESNKSMYGLTSAGMVLLHNLRQTDLCRDISSSLSSVGKVPESYLKQLQIDWYAEV